MSDSIKSASAIYQEYENSFDILLNCAISELEGCAQQLRAGELKIQGLSAARLQQRIEQLESLAARLEKIGAPLLNSKGIRGFRVQDEVIVAERFTDAELDVVEVEDCLRGLSGIERDGAKEIIRDGLRAKLAQLGAKRA